MYNMRGLQRPKVGVCVCVRACVHITSLHFTVHIYTPFVYYTRNTRIPTYNTTTIHTMRVIITTAAAANRSIIT